MKNKYWKIKNSYAAKSLVNQQGKQHSLFAKKLTVRNLNKQESLSKVKYLSRCEDANKESNFEQLKKEIEHLQNSQILSMKYNYHTEPDEHQSVYQFKSTGKQFFPSKKVAHFQKFKLYLKKKGKSKKLSLLLDSSNKYISSLDYQCLDSLKIKDLNLQTKGQIKLKKKDTPYIIKKFYRPMTSNHKSLEDLNMRSTEIRGRKLKTSVTNRRDKQNVLICCY